MDRGDWRATVPGVEKNQMTKQQHQQWLMMLNITSNAYLYTLFMSFAHFLIRSFILSLLSLGFLCIL